MKKLVMALVLSAVACGDDGGAGGGPAGRGSAACQSWQGAVCDLAADECKLLTREQCDRQYKGIACASDAKAEQCANAINAASCTMGVAMCDFADVGDPKPAIDKCNAFVRLLCERTIQCDATAKMDDCLAELAVSLDCSRAIGATLDYESCLEQIGALPCTAQKLPDICDNVITANR